MAKRKKRAFFRNRGTVPQQAIMAGKPAHQIPMLHRMLQAVAMGHRRGFRG